MLEVQLSEQLTVDRRLWSVDKIGQQSMVDGRQQIPIEGGICRGQ